MMIITTSFSVFRGALWLLLLINIYGGHSQFAGNGAKCLKEERKALLEFKAELIDDYGQLSDWGYSSNCCGWKGILCDNRTNHVVALDLHAERYDARLKGTISPSLLQLHHLRYLDLSSNNIFDENKTIPYFIGSFTKLQHLNLSYGSFSGPIPHHLGNLSTLQLLDLSYNAFYDINLDWVSGLQSLVYLDLGGAYVGDTNLQAILKLTALKEMHLSECGLTSVEPLSLNYSNSLRVLDLSYNSLDSGALEWFLNISNALTHIDFSHNDIDGMVPNGLANLLSLSYLDLGHNGFEISITNDLGNLTSLSYLDMSSNNLDGHLPRLLAWFQDSTRLKYLDLSENLFSGSLPNISRFSSLRELYLRNAGLSGPLEQDNLRLPNLESLDLSANKFTGRLPNLSSSPSLRVLHLLDTTFDGSLMDSIRDLPKIEQLHAAYSNFEDVITDAHLSSLPQLRVLDLSFNSNITVKINHSWIHPVQFEVLDLAYCTLGPDFPRWLQKHNKLRFLDISNSGISDGIPTWFWGNVYSCSELNMSHNRIYGTLPDLSSNLYDLGVIDLSSNELNGTLPHFSGVSTIDLSRNKFSGPILTICKPPNSIRFLDLSNNLLSGEIPRECSNLLQTFYLNLANNNLSGEISTINHFGCRVSSLHLRNNSFKGEIPRSLLNCSNLRILDLGENEFNGHVPEWLGASMLNLAVLILKSNKIYGSLPSSICLLENIQVLDISLNMIGGTIPNCINKFIRLSLESDPTISWEDMFSIFRNGSDDFHDSASIIWKGHDETYINNLGLLKMIDLSSNELTGVIPHEITSLRGLVGLNLSGNNLVGLIPLDIDQMKILNFLDLSRNNLSGEIPPNLSKLSHLGVLNLSFNNLSGRIPWDTHMQTFGASTYLGNPELCGPPLLSKPCPSEDEKPTNGKQDEEEDKFITRGFYISMLIGFGVAFWTVFWTLCFNKWWNVSTMRIYNWFYVKVTVNKRR